MKLYMVHCGYYEDDAFGGLYEDHRNVFVAAESFEDARRKAKELPEFRAKKMHVDGIQEISAISGFSVSLNWDESLQGKTKLLNLKHRELAALSSSAKAT